MSVGVYFLNASYSNYKHRSGDRVKVWSLPRLFKYSQAIVLSLIFWKHRNPTQTKFELQCYLSWLTFNKHGEKKKIIPTLELVIDEHELKNLHISALA